jgi:hypothetical protein
MASDIDSDRVVRSTSDFTLLPRDPWPNQIQYLLLVFEAKKSLELTEKAFKVNTQLPESQSF